MAGMIKSWLTREESRLRYYRDTESLKPFFKEKIDRSPTRGADEETMNVDEEMERTTQGDGQVEHYGRMRFSTIVSHYIKFGEVNHVYNFDAPAIEGIKSFHSFVQVPGGIGKVLTFT